jgi:hypothetical protein
MGLLKVFVLMLGALTVGGSLAVLVAYVQAWRSGRRALPLHVVPIALSYVLILLLLMGCVWAHGTVLPSLAVLFACAMGLYGLLVILGAV